MINRLLRLRPVAVALVLILGPAASAGAQAWNYPSFQTPRVTTREFNFGIADGGQISGNSFVFQWREGRTARTQLSLDLGVAQTDLGAGAGDDTRFVAGVQLGHQLVFANQNAPVDILMTVGVNGAFGGGSLVSIPFGASLGRRFVLDGGLALTPYIHPRLALDYCGECDAGDGESELETNIDLGASFDVTRNVALRISATFGDDDGFIRSGDAFGVSLAWTTAFVRR